MVQNFDLSKMGLTPMSEIEMIELEGGNFWKVLEGIGLVALAVGIAIGSGGLATAGAAAIVVGYLMD